MTVLAGIVGAVVGFILGYILEALFVVMVWSDPDQRLAAGWSLSPVFLVPGIVFGAIGGVSIVRRRRRTHGRNEAGGATLAGFAGAAVGFALGYLVAVALFVAAVLNADSDWLIAVPVTAVAGTVLGAIGGVSSYARLRRDRRLALSDVPTR
jgi:hypothetical protein